MKIKVFGKQFEIVSRAALVSPQNTLYLYIENVDGVIYAKFGEAFDQTIWQRYNHTGDTQHNKIIKVWKSEIHDTPIHNVLHELFQWAGKKEDNPLNTKEAYVISSADELQKMINTISDIVENSKIGPNFFRDRFGESPLTPRLYQLEVMDKAKKALKKYDRVLINLSTRAGKSYVSLKICKDLGAKNILILTPFPAAEDSFEKLADFNEEFRDYKYIHLTRETKEKDFCNKNIIFCSYQFFDETKEICQKMISSIKFDYIILDECHNTSDSERTEEILKIIKHKKLVYMSGTPFNDIYSGYFMEDEVVTFDFIDFIKFAKAHPDQVKLPKLHIKNVHNIEKLQKDLMKLNPEIFSQADAFDFSVIFSDEQHAEAYFTWLLQPVKSSPLIISKPRWFDLSDQKRILAFFSTNKQVDIAAKVLRKVLPNYNIKKISSKENADISNVNEKIINKEFENEKTIILTCGKLTTGVTLSKLDTVWLFKNTSSAEQFIQILFRTMTPCEGKTDATMYCFDSETSLKVIKEYASVRLNEMSTNVTKSENDTYMSVIEDILYCINFTYLADSYTWKDEKPEDYFEKLHKLPYSQTVVSLFRNFHAFDNIDDLGFEGLKQKDLQATLSQGVAISGQCEHNNNLKKFMKKTGEHEPSKEGLKQELTEKVVKQLLKVLINLDKKVFVDNSIKTYKDLEKLIPKELENYKANYNQLLEDNKLQLNQMIEDIRYKETHNMIIDLVMGMSRSNSTDMSTPPSLVNIMINKLSDRNGTICDPCAGTGLMLLECVKAGFKKEDCYGIELDPINVAICHKLGFTNVIQGDVTDPKTYEKFDEIEGEKNEIR